MPTTKAPDDQYIAALSSTKRPRMLKGWVLWTLFFIAVFAVTAASFHTDGTPDFRLYHYYNGWAAHVDRSSLDIFPAQLQTTFFNGVDAIYYTLFTKFNDHPHWLNAVLSLPYGICACAIFFLARRFVPTDVRGRDVISAAAALVGLTGASALPTLATTMTDITQGTPLVVAVVLWLLLEMEDRNSWATALLLGALAGLGVGLKLTLVPMFVGLTLVVLLRRGPQRLYAGFLEAFSFGAAGVAVFALVDARWLWTNWQHYDNPIFPLMNNVFRSDLVAPSPWTDPRFMPKSTLMALFYPAFWAFNLSHDAIELNMRDPRILVGCVCALIILFAAAWRRWRADTDAPTDRVSRAASSLSLMFLVSYVLWVKVWSIYRYLAVQETLCGVLVIAALVTLIPSTRRRGVLLFSLSLALFGTIVAFTAYPWWSRAQRGPRAVVVTLPPIEKDAMVLFLDPYFYAYLVPFMPPEVHAIAANSDFVGPGSEGTLMPRIDAAVRNHGGPFWGFEDPVLFPGVADATLAHLHLVRSKECSLLDTNMEDRRIVKICRLQRS
jgi:hypothetical protein